MTLADPSQIGAYTAKPARNETEAERDARYTRTFYRIAAALVAAAIAAVSVFGIQGLAVMAVALVPLMVACLIRITWV